MADVFDSHSDSGDEIVSTKRGDSLVEYVIQQAMIDSDEEIPGDGEFWKPVTQTCYKEGDISICHTTNYGNLNLNRHNVSDVSFSTSGHGGADTEESCTDKNPMRKAVSDDSLAFKRQEDMKREIPDQLIPTFQSEKGSPEMKRNRRQCQSFNDSAEFESSSSEEEEIDPAEDRFDFCREYERKVDLLEYCDMAVEESFDILRQHVLGLMDTVVKSEETEGCMPTYDHDDTIHKSQKAEDDKTDPECPSDAKETEERETNVPTRVDQIAEILRILRTRFENFISEVSELIHLGFLSMRHAQRVDTWGADVQKTYQRIYLDHQRMKAYLEEREACWEESREQYQSEIVRQGQQITNILQKIQAYTEEPDTSRRCNNRMKTADIVNSVLVKRRCQEEQAMTLDFARQAKISELKLLIIQQQGYIQRLQLKNAELNGIIRDVLHAKPSSPDGEPEEEECQLQTVSDVLNCDQAGYIPNKSTDPDTVGRHIFNVGNSTSYSGPSYPVFDPRKLSYICLDALPVEEITHVEEFVEDEDGPSTSEQAKNTVENNGLNIVRSVEDNYEQQDGYSPEVASHTGNTTYSKCYECASEADEVLQQNPTVVSV